jgi:hypothetical protein
VDASATGNGPRGLTSDRIEPEAPVLGEEEALVLEVNPFEVHGLTYYDVTVAFRDRSIAQARLGPESVPENLERGEQVLASRVAGMLISLKRHEGSVALE